VASAVYLAKILVVLPLPTALYCALLIEILAYLRKLVSKYMAGESVFHGIPSLLFSLWDCPNFLSCFVPFLKMCFPIEAEV